MWHIGITQTASSVSRTTCCHVVQCTTALYHCTAAVDCCALNCTEPHLTAPGRGGECSQVCCAVQILLSCSRGTLNQCCPADRRCCLYIMPMCHTALKQYLPVLSSSPGKYCSHAAVAHCISAVHKCPLHMSVCCLLQSYTL